MASFDDLVGEIELAVELQRSRLHCDGARSRSRRRGLVDDAEADALLCEPEREHQSRGACADDQNVAAFHRFLPHLTASRLPHESGSFLRSMPSSSARACCPASASRSGRSALTTPNTSRNNTAITIGPAREKA